MYVSILALVIWALLVPLRPQRWSYRNVLLFVVMTSPPALLYAIPVERLVSLDAARDLNVWFLAVVATWRVALYVVFLRKVAGLRTGDLIVASLLPLALIVSALAAFNLEHVVFRLMSGIRATEASANDAAYGVVWLLSWLSILRSPVLLAGYAWAVYKARGKGLSSRT